MAGARLSRYCTIHNGIEYYIDKEKNRAVVASLVNNDIINVKIPDSIYTIPIVAIKSNAFRQSVIKSITFPNSVANIGINAFLNCLELESVCQTNGNETSSLIIHDGAFYNCRNLNTVHFSRTIKLAPGGMHFYKCSQLTSMKENPIDSGSDISANSFLRCEKLTDLTFVGCKKLHIPDNAFKDCLNLNTIGFDCPVDLSTNFKDFLRRTTILNYKTAGLLDLAYEGYAIINIPTIPA